MGITIEQVIEEIAEWRGRHAVFQPLPGGYSNLNYRVEVDDQPFFVRIPYARADLLAVNRDNEYHNALAAAEIGVGPKVLRYLQEHHVMILEFIPGETMSIPTLQSVGTPTRVARSMRLLHAGRRFLDDFDIFRLADFYLQVVADNGIELPAGYIERLPLLASIEDALMQRPMPGVPCHNDLIPENIIDDGNLLRFVDYEYSGNNDPCFELGNAAQSLEYDEAQTVELCTAYFGTVRRSWLARVHLFALTSHLAWTLWSVIQNKFSEIAYDFWENTLYHWEPALRILESDAFPAWLEQAQSED